MEFQPGFNELVISAREHCVRRFGPRLRAAYVAGSVASNEAWPGASDLDWFALLEDEPSAADKSWRIRTQRKLEHRFPVAKEVHLNLFSMDWLRREAFSRFILRYNSVRIAGANVVAELAREGFPTPRPSLKLAKQRLPFVRRCLSETLAGRCPPALAGLPDDPCLASRKLARNFVLVEGAFILMAVGVFRSFKQQAVLDGLRSRWGRWSGLSDMCERILTDPHKAAIHPGRLMRRVGPFIEWGIGLIERS